MPLLYSVLANVVAISLAGFGISELTGNTSYTPLQDLVSEGVTGGLTALVDVLVFALPNSDGLPAIVDTAFLVIGQKLAYANVFFPVDHMLVIMSMFIVIHFIVFGVKLALNLAYFVRGVRLGRVDIDTSPL